MLPSSPDSPATTSPTSTPLGTRKGGDTASTPPSQGAAKSAEESTMSTRSVPTAVAKDPSIDDNAPSTTAAGDTAMAKASISSVMSTFKWVDSDVGEEISPSVLAIRGWPAVLREVQFRLANRWLSCNQVKNTFSFKLSSASLRFVWFRSFIIRCFESTFLYNVHPTEVSVRYASSPPYGACCALSDASPCLMFEAHYLRIFSWFSVFRPTAQGRHMVRTTTSLYVFFFSWDKEMREVPQHPRPRPLHPAP